VDKSGHISRGELFGVLLVYGARAAGDFDPRELLRSYAELNAPSISVDQLASVAAKHGFPRETAEEVMQIIDSNGTGRLEFSELSLWMRKSSSMLAGTDESEGLGDLMACAHKEKEHARRLEVQARVDKFRAAGPEILAINQSLGAVLTTRRDVLDAEALARRLRATVRERAPSQKTTDGFTSHLYKSYVRELVGEWEGQGAHTDGHISVREMHEGLVLLGIEDGSAGSVQELFDEIDTDGGDSVQLEEIADFIVFGDDNALFTRREKKPADPGA